MDALRGTRLAPAKINLSLRVIGRRQDGLHEIDSIFLPLELADRVTVKVRPHAPARVTCICPGKPELDGPDNLAARAAAAFLKEAACRAAVSVTLHKQIWTAAGLGGGSSDAAAVLILLQDLLGRLPAARRRELALSLGADVLFFLDPRPARVGGTGERIHHLQGFPCLDLVLVNPRLPLATREVYLALGLARGAPRPGPGPGRAPDPVAETGHWTLQRALSRVGNDLEVPALGLCPEIAALRHSLLDAGALAASLSGSGPTVFGIFEDSGSARQAARSLRESTPYAIRACRTTSPERAA